jgi:hypothetical protein
MYPRGTARVPAHPTAKQACKNQLESALLTLSCVMGSGAIVQRLRGDCGQDERWWGLVKKL